jgi:hypothetical protein
LNIVHDWLLVFFKVIHMNSCLYRDYHIFPLYQLKHHP